MKLYKFKVELKKVLRKNFMIYWHKIKDISINTGKLCTYFTYKDTFKFEEYLHIKKFTYRQIYANLESVPIVYELKLVATKKLKTVLSR